MKHIEIILGDCMDVMAQYPEKYFDLAVVDPPYGIGVISSRSFGDALRKDGTIRHGIDKRNGNLIKRKPSSYKIKEWDNEAPNDHFFYNLLSCTQNQIIWGANHFISKIPYDSSCWIVWDKCNSTTDFADCEMAWTSFNSAARLFKFMWSGMLQGKSINEGHINQGNKALCQVRIHPTEKPIILYDWIYQKYLPEGGKVLDTHGGSMSNVISWIKAGNIDGVCVEIDKDYYEAAKKRINQFLAQQDMFRNPVKVTFK